MKNLLTFILVLVALSFSSNASIITFDDSSDPVYANGWSWQNGGSGFDPGYGVESGIHLMQINI